MTLETQVELLAAAVGAQVKSLSDRATALENAPGGGGGTGGGVEIAKLSIPADMEVNARTFGNGGTVIQVAIDSPPSWLSVAADFTISFSEPADYLMIFRPSLFTVGSQTVRGNIGWQFNGEFYNGSNYVRSSNGHNETGDCAIWCFDQTASAQIIAGQQTIPGPYTLDASRTQLMILKLN